MGREREKGAEKVRASWKSLLKAGCSLLLFFIQCAKNKNCFSFNVPFLIMLVEKNFFNMERIIYQESGRTRCISHKSSWLGHHTLNYSPRTIISLAWMLVGHQFWFLNTGIIVPCGNPHFSRVMRDFSKTDAKEITSSLMKEFLWIWHLLRFFHSGRSWFLLVLLVQQNFLVWFPTIITMSADSQICSF